MSAQAEKKAEMHGRAARARHVPGASYAVVLCMPVRMRRRAAAAGRAAMHNEGPCWLARRLIPRAAGPGQGN